VGEKLYVGSTHKITNPIRRKYLRENKEKLDNLLSAIFRYIDRHPEDTRFFRYYIDEIDYFHSFFRKEKTNTLTESNIFRLINFLQSTLELTYEKELKEDDLVDYMYELVNECIRTYYTELKEANKLIDNMKYNELFYSTNNIFYSWQILSENVAQKEIDKSFILYGMTGVPKEVRDFFLVSNTVSGFKKKFIIQYENREYESQIEMRSDRSRLFFNKEFRKIIQKKYSHIYKMFTSVTEININIKLPLFQFIRIHNKPLIFEVKFIEESKCKVIQLDTEQEEEEYYQVKKEGNVIEYYLKKYERNPHNRLEAIRIHGLTCFGCNFNFEEKYGDWGKDFIEVHHIIPLSTLEEEIEVNPETDLVPLCANCHRMVHRRKDKVLTLEELKVIIGKV